MSQVSAVNMRRPRRRAFTLIEAIVVILILAVLATVIAPRLIGRVGQAKTSTAQSKAASLATAMKLFMTDAGMPPSGSTINVLWERPSEVDAAAWKGPYIDNREALNDPWGRPFVLRMPGIKNVDFDIVSYGADGQPDGDGENADVVAP